MANILIWGDARRILAGDLPRGAEVVEVGTLEELREKVAADHAIVLVLADTAHLTRDPEAVAAWSADGRKRPLLIGVAPNDEVDSLIERCPALDDVLVTPLTAARLRLSLDRTLEALDDRKVIGQLDGALTRKSEELHHLNAIGVALSAERDIDKLLEMILLKSREITAADAGSLYLVERTGEEPGQPQLRFKLTQNDSVAVPFAEFTMPLTETSIAGYAALTGKGVKVADAYHLPPESPFQVSRSFDEHSGYRTKSMLVVPMKDHREEVIGVVQLINKKRDAGAVLRPVAVVEEMVTPFTAVDEELVTSLASQAAVALENTLLIQDIKNLFDSFVRASVTAIEKRDETTKGHSERVAILTVGIAETVDAIDRGPFADLRFNRDQIQEIRYASVLHDFGKVSVPEKVLVKAKKLYVGEMLLIQQRFAYVKRSLEVEHLRAKLEQVLKGEATEELLEEMDRAHRHSQEEMDRLSEMVEGANQPSILEEESVRALMDLPSRSYRDLKGERRPLLTPSEVSALSIRRGTLSAEERQEIESHVRHTFEFLLEIPWTGEYRRIPEIAHAHHEKLDGTGYPQGLTRDEIPVQSKMMTISDIYDALVAWDRPYKNAVPVPRALDILGEEAEGGKIDSELLKLFIDARIYEKTRQPRSSKLQRQEP